MQYPYSDNPMDPNYDPSGGYWPGETIYDQEARQMRSFWREEIQAEVDAFNALPEAERNAVIASFSMDENRRRCDWLRKQVRLFLNPDDLPF